MGAIIYANMDQKLTASEQLVGELRSKVVGSAREIALLRERIADLSGRSANNKSEKRLQIAEACRHD
jgi:hypothetical protein